MCLEFKTMSKQQNWFKVRKAHDFKKNYEKENYDTLEQSFQRLLKIFCSASNPTYYVSILTNYLIIAGFKLLLPVCRVSLHSLQPLGELVDLRPEVRKVPVLDGVRTNGTAHFSLKNHFYCNSNFCQERSISQHWLFDILKHLFRLRNHKVIEFLFQFSMIFWASALLGIVE